MQQRLRTIGITWAIDDFASGHDPFKGLRELTFEFMKIDGVFVEGAKPHGADLGILRAFIGLADEQAMDLVTSTGATYAQGHLVGCPVAPEQFIRTYLDPAS